MSTGLYWVDAAGPGRLAIAARPRGEDWLQDEIAAWRGEGIDLVVSLLTPEEEESLGLKKEARLVKTNGMDFVSFPITDREVPSSVAKLANLLEKANLDLSAGKNVLIHCRQGIGRTGLVAACLLVTRGWDPSAAVDHVASGRGVPIPETAEQRRWIDHFAATLAGAK
jgi:protein-tyrosine phosphatase